MAVTYVGTNRIFFSPWTPPSFRLNPNLLGLLDKLTLYMDMWVGVYEPFEHVLGPLNVFKICAEPRETRIGIIKSLAPTTLSSRLKIPGPRI